MIINSPSNPSGAVLSKEEFLGIYELTSRRGILLMTDECYCQFLYDDKPFSIAAADGREGQRGGCRFAFEDLRDDRVAHRFCAGASADHQRHDEAAEPQHVEPDVDCAEGRGGSDARLAGFGSA